MKKALALIVSGGIIGVCVTLALLGKFPLTGEVAASGLEVLTNAALAFLGVLGLMVVSTVVWSIYAKFFDRTNGNDLGLILAMLWLGLNILMAIGCVIAVIATAPLATVLTVAAVIEGLFTVFACYEIS